MGGQWRGVSTTSLSNTTAGEICTRLGFSGDGELNAIIYVCHNYECFIIITEPTVMSFELTRGDVYCCNNELNCTHCNLTVSVGLSCSSQYSTTMPPTTMMPVTPPSSVTTISTTETTTAQQDQITGDGGSVTAVIVVLVLAMATGCIVTCAVIVWKRTRARKNDSIEMR